MKQRRTLKYAILGGLLLCSADAFCGGLTDASNTTFKARKKFLQLGYSYNKFSRKDGASLNNDMGMSFTWGRSYYLHKPINGRLRIGLDWAWTDINYNSYKVNYQYVEPQALYADNDYMYDDEDDDYSNVTMHGVDVGMQIGPSVTYNISKSLQAHGYVRYAPCFSALYDGESLQGGFGNFFVVGANISYKFIGVGIEGRFGTSTYKNISDDDDESDDDYYYDDTDDDFINDGVHLAPGVKGKTSFSGFRAYITFRF